MISLRFQSKPFSITVIQVYAPNTGAEEAEVDWFHEDIKHVLEPTCPPPCKKKKKDVLFIKEDWSTK